MREIFVSYRRKDTPSARLLCDRLRSQFGKDIIFWDLDSIRPGQNFLKEIEAAVKSCRLVLAIVSPSWNSKDESGQRELMNRTDWVRFELNIALQEGKPIIPVLVQSASMSAPKELPPELKEFAHLNAIELSDSRWEYDVGQLTEAIRKEAHIKLKLQPKSSEFQPEAPSTFSNLHRFSSPSVQNTWIDPKFAEARRQEWKKRLQEEEKRKQKARAANPLFYQMKSWWISTALNFGACIGLALIIMPLVEWSLAIVLGWFSISQDVAAQVDHPILAVTLSGVVWAVVYSAVAAANYADDPELGRKAFFLRGLLGGWVLWLEDLETGPGIVGSFPLNVLTVWTLARYAAWVSCYFLGVSPDIVAYIVLGGSTALCVAWYVLEALP